MLPLRSNPNGMVAIKFKLVINDCLRVDVRLYVCLCLCFEINFSFYYDKKSN